MARDRYSAGLLAVASVLLIGASPSDSGRWHSFGNWQAVCDNISTCTAFGFPNPGGAMAWISVRRDAGPSAAPVVMVSLPVDRPPPASMHLAFSDGRQLDILGPKRDPDPGALLVTVARSTAADALLAGLKTAPAVTASIAGNAVLFPLNGAAAALRWIGVQQGRGGHTPPLIALARLRVAPESGHVPAAVATLLARQACDLDTSGRNLPDGDPRDFSSERIVLRFAPHLMLWGMPCTAGAYNLSIMFATLDARTGEARLVHFPPTPSAPPSDDTILVNPTFDPALDTLTSFGKERGIADCGEAASYGWDGRAWRLVAYNSMPDCRGVNSAYWPSVFQSRRH